MFIVIYTVLVSPVVDGIKQQVNQAQLSNKGHFQSVSREQTLVGTLRTRD